MIEPPLLNRLKASIEGMGLNRVQFGFPEMIIKEVQKAETLFKEFSKAAPSTQDAYKAALMLLQGEPLDDWSADLVAAAVSIPIKEHGGLTVLESQYCDDLLRKYENDAYSGYLWRPTWYSLLNSYLTFDPRLTSTEKGMAGFSKLRRLLNRTWPSIDKQSGQQAVPDWVRTLREESQLLSEKPVEKYAHDYLSGNTNNIKAIGANLGIPGNSWFWQELILGAVRHAANGSDEQFRGQILMLIELVKSAPVFRDKAISEILNRYYKSSSRTVHPELRDFVIHTSVWKNPKLKAAGIATAWNQVPDAVWRMVMGWVNERNLKDFFDILAVRRHADHGRLKFWSRYMNQISWTRLVFGSETIWQKNHNVGIKALLESEEGTYATLKGTADKELDAFLMQIGEYIFVEFSKTGNGAYAYRASDLAFNLHAESYAGSTSDLKCGFYRNGRSVIKVIHTTGWEARSAIELSKLGIHPDRVSNQHEPARGRLSSAQTAALENISNLTEKAAHVASEVLSAGIHQRPVAIAKTDTLVGTEYTIPSSAKSDNWTSQIKRANPYLPVEEVNKIVSKYEGASSIEKAGAFAMRSIWVTNPSGWPALESELKKLGFQWSESRKAWYLRDE